ncbi:MAG: hypothetical protein IJ313_02930 [Clostridia bacterium]|nr:hypothetical protein [Clostridia bacterium]
MSDIVFVHKPSSIEDVLAKTALTRARRSRPVEEHFYIAQEQTLGRDEWFDLLSDLVSPREWIRTFAAQNHPVKGKDIPCIRVRLAQGPSAILIDPSGYDYPRYAAIEHLDGTQL